MTEMAKSVLFTAAAAASLLVAFAISPSGDVQNLDELVGVRLNQFEVDVAKRLKIVKFDQETASTREFEVAENDGLWSIPSKQDYPADAARQMGEAATCLIDREVLRIAGKSANDHEALGVIDPGTSKLDSKAEGVGTRVTITDANDSVLADMIIGKGVKEAEGQYYVRNADQDVVYVVSLDPEKLSTKFEDWIEDDLLKLNPMDIRRVNIKDYTAELQPILTAAGIQMQVKWDRRGEMTLGYDQGESKWQPEQLQKLDPEKKELVDYELAEGEELNEESLRELRNGLDDLLLVDVERKPSGLSADLKAGSDFLKNQDAANSLIGRGFAPLAITPGAPPEILSTEGEVTCSLQDGVEYVLRFGNLQIGDEEDSSDAPDGNSPAGTAPTGGAPSDEETPDSNDGINRYLFVMARFNESMIEQPELADIPELPAETGPELPAETGETANEGDTTSDDDTTEGDTTEGDTTEGDTTDGDTTEGAGGEGAESEESGEPDSGDRATAGEEAAGETDQAEADGVDDDQTDEDQTDEDQTKKEAEKDDQRARLIAERARIEKENERKLNEYKEKIAAGKERVTELNGRFGDWYYVISNDVYNKIHLSRAEVIKKKEAEAEASGSEAPAGLPGGGLPGLPNLPIGEAN